MRKTEISCPRVWKYNCWSHTREGIVREHLKENRWSKFKLDNSHSREVISANFKIIILKL